jgi:succinate-acetate transporter protein
MDQARVVLRPMANPLPLGFASVAIATIVDSGLNLKWFPLAEHHEAAVVILLAAPLTQIIAYIFGYLTRDPVAATGMGIQAVGWAGTGLLLLLAPPEETQAVLGTFLFGAAAVRARL